MSGPILDKVAAGKHFYVIAGGTGMIPEIGPGCLVLIDPRMDNYELVPGNIVLADLGPEGCTLRRILHGDYDPFTLCNGAGQRKIVVTRSEILGVARVIPKDVGPLDAMIK